MRGIPEGKFLICTNPECKNKDSFVVPVEYSLGVDKRGVPNEDYPDDNPLNNADWTCVECSECGWEAKWVDKVEAFAKGGYKDENRNKSTA